MEDGRNFQMPTLIQQGLADPFRFPGLLSIKDASGQHACGGIMITQSCGTTSSDCLEDHSIGPNPIVSLFHEDGIKVIFCLISTVGIFTSSIIINYVKQYYDQIIM